MAFFLGSELSESTVSRTTNHICIRSTNVEVVTGTLS